MEKHFTIKSKTCKKHDEKNMQIIHSDKRKKNIQKITKANNVIQKKNL